MDRDQLSALLERVAGGETTAADALEELRALPLRQLPYATVDHHRLLRRGFPEVVLGQGKTAEQIVGIVTELARGGGNVLVTRVTPAQADVALAEVPGLVHEAEARCLVLRQKPFVDLGRGPVTIVCAGTSDLPVAREAVVTAELMGNAVALIYDVGVAGLHRLLHHHDALTSAAVLIVVAGMEGALPSVVGGLVARPVIAVPTSVGYGAAFAGVTALLGMLSSCAAGVTVVNIDNGFGAAYAASLINRREPA